ncbi:MAG: phosphotransferase [Betaproteobacteria bacterium]|nr:phosphotransferase [Betaproteobacteria bacterium]
MTSVPIAPTSGEACTACDQRPLVESLRTYLATLHGCAHVELLETHISFVLVAGDFAYKLKKAVKLPFLDFSTLDARRYYCEQELRLNRRYAPQLYLDVVPVTGSAGNPDVGGAGPAIEYAVWMRAFAQQDLASRVLQRGALSPQHIDALAARVATFHESIARAGVESPFGTPAVIRQDALDNIDEIGRLPGATGATPGLDRLRQWTESESAALAGTFLRRRAGGFVRECHGDLHLDNIALVDGEITPFDGIEFNDELRWIDVMNEIAFLLMDLRYRGRPDLAARFLNAWLEHTGDYPGLAVLRYYVVYRALVRAKVAFLRAAQGHLDASARRAARRPRAPPRPCAQPS